MLDCGLFWKAYTIIQSIVILAMDPRAPILLIRESVELYREYRDV